ncbi:Rha family transcriptional regulator [Candidatus Liberibacter africanus]|uniref:Rha family transcriptional regulator n=1 Tax=Liberibacter africanus TaxID=34020 RepID=UPI00339DA583
MTTIPEVMRGINRVSDVKTMSSREIAELTGKRHDHILRDVEVMFKELEVSHPKFGASDFKGNYIKRGKEYPCYYLPKRECLILVSGYDVNLRARIIDRWAELEVEKRQREKAPKLKVVSPTSYIKVHKFIEEKLSQTGLKENQLVLATNRGVAKLTGFDLLASAEVTLLSPSNDECLTPTQIGEKLDPVIGAREVNKLLLGLGLQTSKISGGYKPTPQGEGLGGQMCDVQMRHGDGSTQHLKWNSSILVPYLQDLINSDQSKKGDTDA